MKNVTLWDQEVLTPPEFVICLGGDILGIYIQGNKKSQPFTKDQYTFIVQYNVKVEYVKINNTVLSTGLTRKIQYSGY